MIRLMFKLLATILFTLGFVLSFKYLTELINVANDVAVLGGVGLLAVGCMGFGIVMQLLWKKPVRKLADYLKEKE